MLEQLSKDFKNILNTSGYYPTPDEQNTFFNLAQGDYFKELAVNFQKTGIMNTMLTNFYSERPFTTSGTTGEGETIYEIPVGANTVIYNVTLIQATYPGGEIFAAQVLADLAYRGRVNSPMVPPAISEGDVISKYLANTKYTILPEPESASAYLLIYPPNCELKYINGT